MRYTLGTTLLVLAVLMPGSPAAQDARGLLQAADRAIGASSVNSVQYNATGWIRFLGQNFTADQDWNRVDLQSYTQTIDYGIELGEGGRVRVTRITPKEPARGKRKH